MGLANDCAACPHVYLESVETCEPPICNLAKCGIPRRKSYEWGNTSQSN